MSAGLAHLAAGDTGGAIAFFQDAIRAQPAFPEAYLGLGRAFSRRGASAEAVRALEIGLTRNPDSAEIASALAAAEADRGRLREALGVMRRAAERHPMRVPLHLSRASYAQLLGAWAEAADAYARVLDLHRAGHAVAAEDIARAEATLRALRLVAGPIHPSVRRCEEADTEMTQAILGC